MPEAMVIFRRELRSYFLSPIAYVFGVLFLAILLFSAASLTIVDGAQASMQPFFGLLPWVLLLFLPALTMRLWAEERKLGTLELLLTFPVSITGLVLGKFCATLTFLSFLLLLTLGLPLTLDVYGGLDWPPVLGGYIASVLFTGSFVAVGMFWSSTTRDQIIAMLLSVVSLLALFVMGYPSLLEGLAGVLPSMVIDCMNGLSPYKYFESIGRGVLDTRDLLYFAAFCGFFLYCNGLTLQARRRKG